MPRNSAPVVTHWGSYTAYSEADEIVAVKGSDQDQCPSEIGRNLIGALRHPARIERPAIRESWLEGGPRSQPRRGNDTFIEVDWDTALDHVAAELDRVRRTHGNRAIYGGSYGWGSAGRFHHAQSQVHRFLNAIGGYTRSVNTYSHAVEEVVLPRLVGDREWFLSGVPRWSQVAEHTEVVLAFGGLPVRSTQVTPGGVGNHTNAWWQEECARRGVDFILVSPMRDEAAALNATWIPIRPNTDSALMLAITHWLIEHDRADLDFVDRCCVGGSFIRAYLAGDVDGQVKDASWASRICGIDAASIVRIAERIAGRRSLVTVTWALQRQHHGEMNYWAAFTLAAFAGSMGLPGGGVGTGYSSMHNAHVTRRVSAAAALPQLQAPVEDFVPVARICDLLLHPGESFDYDGQRLTYPDIRLVYWIGGNPYHHHQDLNRLLRAWERPESIIVHEPYWTATAKRADIVLPAALAVERSDIAIGMGDPWLQWMAPVLPPAGQARTDYEIFSSLAARLGRRAEFTEDRSADEWIRLLYGRTMERCADLGMSIPDFDAFIQKGSFRLPLDDPPEVVFSELRKDPAGSPLSTPSGKIELYSEAVAAMGHSDCPGYAAWLEPAEWLGSTKALHFPLHLISHQPDRRLHSQFDFGAYSAEGKLQGREILGISAADARDRGIESGMAVRIFNDRGSCLAVAEIRSGLVEGVVQLPTGAWFDPLAPDTEGSLDKGGNPNVLTPDLATSALAQGPSAHTCLVEVEAFLADLPRITAHDPPLLKILPTLRPPTRNGKGRSMDTLNAHDNQHFIGGEWVVSQGDSPIEVIDARTGKSMGRAPAGCPVDLDQAVAAARDALPAWQALTPQQRGDWLHRLADGLERRQEEIAQIICREVGATYGLSFNVQAAVPMHSLRTAAAIAEEYPYREEIDNSIIVREPIGVVGAITAWNFPLHLVTVKAAYAMAAGNTVVVKPSEFAPLSARILAEVCEEIGLPPGVLNIVFGTGPIVGEALVSHPGVGAITFTGSTRAGKRISELAADHVKKVTLELGGKSPNIVLDDADLRAAVEFCVTDCIVNNGQRCDALTRLLVPRARLAEAEAIVSDRMASLRVGDPLDEGIDVGPVISSIQLDRVQGLIEAAIAEGARVVVGGPGKPDLPEELRGGYFVKPTAFSDVARAMKIAQEEVFGPVLVIQAYETEDEAIAIANDTVYGLHACIWSGSEERAMRVAEKIEAGLVKINDSPLNLLAPYGGYKHSGLGREYGKYGFEEFLEVKTICTTHNVRPWF